MKKLLLLCSLLLLTSLLSLGQTTIPYVFYSNTAFGSAGNSATVNNTNSGAVWHEVTWTVTGGTFTACSFKVDSSLDGIAWNDGDIKGATNCALNGQITVVNFVANYSRVRLVTYTANVGTPILKTIYTGYINNPVGGGVNPTSGVIPINSGGTLVDSVIQPGATAPAGDVLCGNGTYFVDCVPGTVTSRTDATGSVQLDTTTTGDRNKVVILTNAGAIALTTNNGPGVNFPDGSTIFVDVRGAAAVATLTPAAGNCNGAATCILLQGFWRVHSDGTGTYSNIEPRTITPPYPAAGTSVTMSTSGYYKCSAACNVTLSVIPGNQYCVRNADNVAAAITLTAVASVQYEATAKTSYYAANRKLVSGGAITDQICIIVPDSTHFDVWSSTGTWTDTP